MKPKRTEKGWPCPNQSCTKRYAFKQSLNNHKKNCKHATRSTATDSSVACTVCFKTFCRPAYLKVHKCKNAPPPSLVCNICQKSFAKQWFFNCHMKTAHSEKPTLKCNKCYAVYKRQDKYKNHVINCVSGYTRTRRERCKVSQSQPEEQNGVDLESEFEYSYPSMIDILEEQTEPDTEPDTEPQSSMYLEEEPFVYVLDDSVVFDEVLSTHNTTGDESYDVHQLPPSSDNSVNFDTSNIDFITDPVIVDDTTSTATGKTLKCPRFYKSSSTSGNALTNSTPHTPRKLVASGGSSQLTPNTRQRKCRLALEHTNFIEALNLVNREDVVDLVVHSLKNLKLYEQLQKTMGIMKVEQRGRKKTPFSTRKLVWDFYRTKSTPSTNTTRPAKQRVADKPKIQYGLNFAETTITTPYRNRQYYQNNWMMLHTTYYELWVAYQAAHPDNKVSSGTFRSLKPFYIRTATEKDVEMCCCKLHLHGSWAITAVINVPLNKTLTFHSPTTHLSLNSLQRSVKKTPLHIFHGLALQAKIRKTLVTISSKFGEVQLLESSNQHLQSFLCPSPPLRR